MHAHAHVRSHLGSSHSVRVASALGSGARATSFEAVGYILELVQGLLRLDASRADRRMLARHALTAAISAPGKPNTYVDEDPQSHLEEALSAVRAASGADGRTSVISAKAWLRDRVMLGACWHRGWAA